MKTQKLQFALTSLQNLQKKKKKKLIIIIKKKKRPTVTIKANKKNTNVDI